MRLRNNVCCTIYSVRHLVLYLSTNILKRSSPVTHWFLISSTKQTKIMNLWGSNFIIYSYEKRQNVYKEHSRKEQRVFEVHTSLLLS
jgi:hypothetical protein